MRYISLKNTEIELLEQLFKNSNNDTVRKRSQCLLLSHQGRTIIDLASIFGVNRRTIERWFENWLKSGTNSLPIQHGRGVKTTLTPYAIDISKQLEVHNRNLKNVLIYLKEQYNITICKRTLRNFLKDTGL